MTKAEQLAQLLAEFEGDVAALAANFLVRARAVIENPDVAPSNSWITLKDAEFRFGRKRNAIWSAAQRIPGASWKDVGGSCYVNADKLQFGPPRG